MVNLPGEVAERGGGRRAVHDQCTLMQVTVHQSIMYNQYWRTRTWDVVFMFRVLVRGFVKVVVPPDPPKPPA